MTTNIKKIVFVQKEYEDKLGPMLLCSVLKEKGFHAEIVINPKKSINYIKSIAPEFIGLSVLSAAHTWALDTCTFIKNSIPGCRTILGGPHPTFFPDIIHNKDIDIICRGEGEKPIFKMMSSYDGTLSSISNIPGLWINDNGSIIKNDVCTLLTAEELSEMPFCDRSQYARYPQLRKNPHKTVLTSRGCPNSCSYCFNHQLKILYKGYGKMVRQRSVESVIAELRQLKKYGWGCLEFCDDQFILSEDWIFEFCKKYKDEIDLPFSCLSSARQLKPNIVKALKAAGCAVVHFAIETGVEALRRTAYNKPIKNSDIYLAAEALHSNSLPFLTFNMVGLPNETIENIYQTIKMNQEIKVTFPWCSIVQPYPGTKMAEYMAEHGVKIPSTFSPTFFQTTPISNQKQQRQIINSQRLFGYLVKSNASFEKFKKLITPPLRIDRMYMPIFYLYYGRSLIARHRMTCFSLFRYWLYSLQN